MVILQLIAHLFPTINHEMQHRVERAWICTIQSIDLIINLHCHLCPTTGPT